MGATELIANFIVDTGYDRIPTEAMSSAKGAIVDSLGCILAGSHEHSGSIIEEYVKELGGNPEASVIGGGFKTSVTQAALANGTMAHALDYDDVAVTWLGHPTVALLPAVLALGERERLSGRDALVGYIVGLEVGAKLGAAIGMGHYAWGWHATVTLGTMAAAATSSKMLGLDAHQAKMALGIATSLAGGTRQNFGTMAHALDYDDVAVTWLGDPFDIVSSGVSMKPYPCCLLTHRCIDAILHLIKEYGVVANDVEKVECRTSEFIPQALIHARPRTALEGKFSMQYCMAIALLDGRIGFKQFTDEKVLDPKAQELLQRVTYVHPEGLIPLQSEAVTIKLKDGRELSHEVATPKGDPQNPMTKKELAVKYRECASFALSPQDTQKSLEMISHLEDIEDITELMDLVR